MDGEQNVAQAQAKGGKNQQTNVEPAEGLQGAAMQENEGAEAAKNADATEKLRDEMGALREAGDARRVEFELMLAGACNATAAHALLGEYDGDAGKLKASDPWPFRGCGRAVGRGTKETMIPKIEATGLRAAHSSLLHGNPHPRHNGKFRRPLDSEGISTTPANIQMNTSRLLPPLSNQKI